MREAPAVDERISEDRYGCFSVLFSNVEGYDMDEITESFREFAEVLGVRRAGDDWGIHFVTFGSYADAKRAVDGLEDHPDIRLKVFHKNKPQCQRRRHDGAERDRARRPAPRRWNARRGARHANDWADEPATGASEEASDDNGEAGRGQEPDAENDESWCTVKNYIESMGEAGLDGRPTPVGSEAVAASAADAEPEQPGAEDARSLSSAESAPEAVVETASEVIVGNVDARVDEAFLLHLFSVYEPIAVSQLVPVGPRADVRFCSVYFKNDEVAKRVERMCDKLCLVGRQMLVQRPSRLIATYLLHI